jgi:hypothetical protein
MMKNINQKRAILILANLVILVLIGYFASMGTKPSRKTASVDDSGTTTAANPLDQFNLSWQSTENGLIIQLSGDDDFCNQWSNLDIVFKAEGIAYSGEVDRVVQTTSCDGGQFQQTWVPNLTKTQDSQYQKSGVLSEEPPMWVMEQIILSGAGGRQVISADDIRREYDSLPTMVPK